MTQSLHSFKNYKSLLTFGFHQDTCQTEFRNSCEHSWELSSFMNIILFLQFCSTTEQEINTKISHAKHNTITKLCLGIW